MVTIHVSVRLEVTVVRLEECRSLMFTRVLQAMMVFMMGSTMEKFHAANAARLNLVSDGFSFASSRFCRGFGGFFGFVDALVQLIDDTAEDGLTFGIWRIWRGGDRCDRRNRWLLDRTDYQVNDRAKWKDKNITLELFGLRRLILILSILIICPSRPMIVMTMTVASAPSLGKCFSSTSRL